MPSAAMVPMSGFPPCIPFTDHVSALFGVFATVAENLCVVSSLTLICAAIVSVTGGFIVKLRALDVLAPGSGFETVIDTVSGVLIVAWNVRLVDDTNWVVTGDPFSATCAPGTKFFPVIVSVKAPMLTWVGVNDVMDGCGFNQVTVAIPVTAGFPADACTVKAAPGFAAGAVYAPPAVIMPSVAFPPATPFTDHVTGPVTLLSEAVNCFVVPPRTDAFEGETLTDGVVARAGSTKSKPIQN